MLGSWNLNTTQECHIMLIHYVRFDIRDDPILQNSSQGPSTSSKYDCVLDALIIMLGSWKFEYILDITNYVDSWSQIWYQRWSNPPKLQPGTTSILQVWLWPWSTFPHARELRIGRQLNSDIWWLFVMSNLLPNLTTSSKTPARNPQHPPSMTVLFMYL